jgi:hypothetical protein
MGETLAYKLPLLDELGQSKGYLYLQWLKRPRDLPRAGETVVLHSGSNYLEGKISEICHSNFFNIATLRFEPVPYSWRSVLQEHDSKWDYFE